MNYVPAFPKPSQKTARVTLSEKQKREQLDRKCAEQQNRCAYCLRRMTRKFGFMNTATRDHIVAELRGCKKNDDDSNIVAACFECNFKKGSRRDWVPKLMPFPKTIEELKAQGYTFVEHRQCKGATCGATLEFWKTPKGKFMPFDVENDNVTAHWVNCPDHENFRK